MPNTTDRSPPQVGEAQMGPPFDFLDELRSKLGLYVLDHGVVYITRDLHEVVFRVFYFCFLLSGKRFVTFNENGRASEGEEGEEI